MNIKTKEYKARTESVFQRAIRNFIHENIVIVIFKTQTQVD